MLSTDITSRDTLTTPIHVPIGGMVECGFLFAWVCFVFYDDTRSLDEMTPDKMTHCPMLNTENKSTKKL
jgi:hypothetical protein